MSALTSIGGHWGRKPLSILIACAATAAPFQASAALNFGGALNYGVLFEGHGKNSLQFNNSEVFGSDGNIGIGGTGSAQLNGPGFITGSIDFSAANTHQYSDSGVAVGAVNYGVTAVQTALNTVNSLSQSLGLETGTKIQVVKGGSVNASTGMLDGSGNEVFTVSSVSFPNGAFTITGNGHDVVLNVPFAASFNGSIVLAGGLTPNQVVINLTPPTPSTPAKLLTYNNDYTALSGGPTLTISTSGLMTQGIFLDPTGPIQINHSLLDGFLWGGDSHNEAVVSGAYIDAVPEPSTVLTGALLLLPFGASTLRILRKRQAA